MAFVDQYSFFATAGSGGDGVVRWRREKYIPKGGPAGGNGGRGGDFYVRAVRDITRLGKLSGTERFHAEAGAPGGSNLCTGRSGERFVLELPVGSVITNIESNKTIELLEEGQEVLLLSGGEGGMGNDHFKSSTNQQPTQCTKGKEGEKGNFTVELRIMADVGLVGLPNAGKTSLLNALTNAGARVGDYPFTTLDPNLGVYHRYVLADIPGLIEGASAGKGLGHKFLRHITRTRFLLHCISLERDTMILDYKTVRGEIEQYEGLFEKPEYVVLTKSDTCSEEQVQERLAEFEKTTGRKVLGTITVLDDDSIKTFGDSLVQKIRSSDQ